MSLIKFQDWIIAKESSAATRSKTAAALGLGPDVASIFGHSTPPPWQTERLLKKLKPAKKVKDKLDALLPEKAEQHPDYSFDKWVDNALNKKKEVEKEKGDAKSKEDDLDNQIKSRLKERESEGGKKISQGDEKKDDFKWEKKQTTKPEKSDEIKKTEKIDSKGSEEESSNEQ